MTFEAALSSRKRDRAFRNFLHWATWHYALHKDLIRLQQEGGWSAIILLTRYAHCDASRLRRGDPIVPW
jgi:hypothetical protein